MSDSDEIASLRPARKVWRLTAQQLNRVSEFIEDNIAKDISIAQLSREIRMSASHFSHCFSDTVGVSPHAFIVQRKMLRAARLLIETDRPLREIAQQVGFSNLRYFRQQFRKSFGCNPAELREADIKSFGKTSVVTVIR